MFHLVRTMPAHAKNQVTKLYVHQNKTMEQAATTDARERDPSYRFSVQQENLLASLWDEWIQLESRSQLRFPFAKPWWTRHWQKHFAQQRLMIRDDFWCLTVRDQQHRLRAVVPMILTQRPGHGPFRLRILRMIGADPNVTEISGPICAPEDQSDVVMAVIEYLHDRASEWDVLSIGGLSCSAVAAAKNCGRLAHSTSATPDYWLSLTGDWDSFRTSLGRNIKESLRKCYNSLKRDGHAFEFHVLSKAEDMPAALTEFFRLHAARATLSDTIMHRDVFIHPRSKCFLAACLNEAVTLGEAYVFQMLIGGAVVATRIGFKHDNQLYLYFSGYDPAWRQYSVMTTLLAETLKWAIAADIKLVNLSIGNDISKQRWHPQETLFHEVRFLSPTLRGKLLGSFYFQFSTSPAELKKWLPFVRRY